MHFRFWILVFLWSSISCDRRRRVGINDCVLVQNEYVTRTVTKSVPYEERKFRFCWSIPPRCSYRVTKYSTQKVVEKHPVTKKSWTCCSGYKSKGKFEPISTDDETTFPTCVPQCENRCYPYGECVAPFQCLCNNGVKKTHCDKREDGIKISEEVTEEPLKSSFLTDTSTKETSTSTSRSVTSEASQTPREIFSLSEINIDSPYKSSNNTENTISVILTTESPSHAVELSEDRYSTRMNSKESTYIDFTERSKNLSTTTENATQFSDTDFMDINENSSSATENSKEFYGTKYMESSENRSTSTDNTKASSDIGFTEIIGNRSITTQNTVQSSDIDSNETSENRSTAAESVQQYFNETNENLFSTTENLIHFSDIDLNETIGNRSVTTYNPMQYFHIDFEEINQNHSITTENETQFSDIDFKEINENSSSTTENAKTFYDKEYMESSGNRSSSIDNTNASSVIGFTETIGNSSITTQNTVQYFDLDFEGIRKNTSGTTEYTKTPFATDFNETNRNPFSTTGNTVQSFDINFNVTNGHRFSTTRNTTQSSDINFKETNENHAITETTKESPYIDFKIANEDHSNMRDKTNKSFDIHFKKANESITYPTSTPNLLWIFGIIDDNSSFPSSSTEYPFDLLKDLAPVFSEKVIKRKKNVTRSTTRQPLKLIGNDSEDNEPWIISTIVGFSLFITLVVFGIIWFMRKRLRRCLQASLGKYLNFESGNVREITEVASLGKTFDTNASSTLSLEPCNIEDEPSINFPTKFREEKYPNHESKIQAIG
ncbi:UNVERIFIED_CONTAM: hypothetical protein RMT77_009927 [Armadillidium vulgare]